MKLLEAVAGIKKGTYRIIGRDNFDNSYFIVKDNIDSEIIAKATQEIITYDEEKLNGKDNEIASTFYVLDYTGRVIYPIIFDTGGEL